MRSGLEDFKTQVVRIATGTSDSPYRDRESIGSDTSCYEVALRSWFYCWGVYRTEAAGM